MIIVFLLLAPSLSLAFCFDEAGRAFGINPALIKGIAGLESNLDPEAMNKNQNQSVDIGLMQVNSSWIPAMGLDAGRLISDPCYNVMTGTKILDMCLKRYGYTWEAVGCYNAVSRPKRVNYSWKLYKAITAERSQTSFYKPEASGSAPSAISFSVRDNATIE